MKEGQKVDWSFVQLMGIVILVACLAIGTCGRTDTEKKAEDPITHSNSDNPRTDVETTADTKPHATPRMELELTEVDEALEGTFDGVGKGRVKGYIMVKNNTDEVLDMVATFTNLGADKEELEAVSDEFYEVAPGAWAMLRDKANEDDVARANYELRAKKSDANRHPLEDGVIVEEVSSDDEQLILKLTNNTKRQAHLEDLRFEYTEDKGARHAGCHYGSVDLRPGTNTKLAITAKDLFDPDMLETWKGFEGMFLFNGFAGEEVSDESKASEDVQPGDTERVPSEHVAISAVGDRLSGSFAGVGPEGTKAYLVVKNETEEPIKLDAKFTYKGADGNEIKGFDDNAEIVDPGASAMLCANAYGADVASVAYKLTSAEPESWVVSPLPYLKIMEASVDAETVHLNITNMNPNRVFLSSCRCLATDADKHSHAAEAFAIGDLEPGKTRELTFDKNTLFDPDAFNTWEGLERTYYIVGHVFLG